MSPRLPFQEGHADQLWRQQDPAVTFLKVSLSYSLLAHGHALLEQPEPGNCAWPGDKCHHVSLMRGSSDQQCSPRAPCQVREALSVCIEVQQLIQRNPVLSSCLSQTLITNILNPKLSPSKAFDLQHSKKEKVYASKTNTNTRNGHLTEQHKIALIISGLYISVFNWSHTTKARATCVLKNTIMSPPLFN